MVGEPVHEHVPTTAPATMSVDGPRRLLVLFMILATAVIFVALFAILYIRWAGSQEPSSVMIIATTPAFDGAEIIVKGVALPEPYRVTVGSRSGSELPFYLDRGSYTLRIERDDQTLYSGDFVMQHDQMLKIPLAKLEHLLPPPADVDAPRRR